MQKSMSKMYGSLRFLSFPNVTAGVSIVSYYENHGFRSLAENIGNDFVWYGRRYEKRKKKGRQLIDLKPASYVLTHLQVALKYSTTDCSLKYAVPTLRQLRGGQCRGRVATSKQGNAGLSLRICGRVIIRLSLGQRYSGLKSDPMMFCRLVLPPSPTPNQASTRSRAKEVLVVPVGRWWVVGDGRGWEG